MTSTAKQKPPIHIFEALPINAIATDKEIEFDHRIDDDKLRLRKLFGEGGPQPLQIVGLGDGVWWTVYSIRLCKCQALLRVRLKRDDD